MGRLQDRAPLRQDDPRRGRERPSRRYVRGALVAAGLAFACASPSHPRVASPRLASPTPQASIPIQVKPGGVEAGGAQASGFDASRAFADLEKQCAFGFRIPATKPHDDCRDWIKAELAKSCDDAFLQHFTHTWSVNGKTLPMDNVVGEINWKDAEVRVALFAHWDTRPFADQDVAANQKKPILGANDAASGVAVLLELARQIKAHPLDKRLGVRFVMIDGEDLGPGSDEMYLGSILYGKSAAPRGDYGILLDMIGDKDLRVPMEPNSVGLVPKLTKAIYAHAAKVGLGETFPAVEGEWAIEDDHLPLIKAGIPTVDLIDFDYEPWHKVTDTPDKCSPASLGKVGRLLETWLRQKTVWKP